MSADEGRAAENVRMFMWPFNSAFGCRLLGAIFAFLALLLLAFSQWLIGAVLALVAGFYFLWGALVAPPKTTEGPA